MKGSTDITFDFNGRLYGPLGYTMLRDVGIRKELPARDNFTGITSPNAKIAANDICANEIVLYSVLKSSYISPVQKVNAVKALTTDLERLLQRTRDEYLNKQESKFVGFTKYAVRDRIIESWEAENIFGFLTNLIKDLQASSQEDFYY